MDLTLVAGKKSIQAGEVEKDTPDLGIVPTVAGVLTQVPNANL